MAFEDQRRRMVDQQLKARGISDERVLAAFLKVPRHAFIPKEFHREAYADHPLPIGEGQTISQPYIVALMVHYLHLQGHERVLEIGTGSGFQTAILAELALEVYSIERLPDLARNAQARLEQLGYLNVHLTTGNGSLGWTEHAPYDGMLVSAGAPRIPEPLLDQLAERGRLVIPLGSPQAQILTLVEKHQQKIVTRELTSCVFVPLLGEYGWSSE